MLRYIFVYVTTCLAFSKASTGDTGGAVIVESIVKNSAGDRAGLQSSDSIKHWKRRGQDHLISSALQLEWIERFEPGPITLTGTRGNAPHEWTISLIGEGGVRYLPDHPFLVSLHNRITQLVVEHRMQAIDSDVESLASQPLSADLKLWGILDAARLCAADQNLPEEQRLLAIGSKIRADATLVAQSVFLDTWARSLQQNKNFEQAQTVYEMLLKVNNRIAPLGLAYADTLHKLGQLNWRARKDSVNGKIFIYRELRVRERYQHGLQYAQALHYAGVFSLNEGRFSDATRYHNEELKILSNVAPSGVDVARTYIQLGNLASMQGDLQHSETLYLTAVKILVPLSRSLSDLGVTWNNLGLLAVQQGARSKAVGYFQQALETKELATQPSDCITCGSTLNNLAMISLELGDLGHADEYINRALTLQRQYLRNTTSLAEALDTSARIQLAKGRLQEAETLYREAVGMMDRFYPSSITTTEVKGGLAEVLLEENRLADAHRFSQQAVSLREFLTQRSGRTAVLLHTLAMIEEKQGHREDARQHFERALDVLDQHVLYDPAINESQVRANYADLYPSYVRFLIESGDVSHALETLERMRARTVLQVLEDAKVKVRTDEPVLDSERQALLTAVTFDSNRRLETIQSGKNTALPAIDQSIELALRRVGQLDAKFAARHPRVTSLTTSPKITAGDICSLLDKKTLLLSYLISDDASYVFMVTRTDVKVFPLPKTKSITSTGKRLYDSWASLRSDKERQPAAEIANQLSNDIFPDGMLPLLRQTENLVVVADGILNYIPFSALPIRGITTIIGTKFVVVNAPSGSVLRVLRDQANVQSLRRAQNQVIVFADPVFSSSDPRVVSGQFPSEAIPAKSMVSLSDRSAGSDNKFQRLPYSRTEADYISRFEENTTKKLGFDASRRAALSPELSHYRIVHFATHGVLDSIHPERSALVLSLVNRNGKPQEGFLTMNDLYHLHLNADLAVLSGCNTALGGDIKGEGIVGLTRGFLASGARQVISSLWPVNDSATADLMRHFYQGLEQQKLSPAEALRLAQSKLAATPGWSDPHFWAGFVIQGDWVH